MPRLIKGAHLTETQKKQVLAAYSYRHLAIGEGKFYPTEATWVESHAFWFVNDGSRLSRNHHHAEPDYFADALTDEENRAAARHHFRDSY